MFGSIFGFELRYRLRRPATYLYFALCFALGLLIMLTGVLEFGGGIGKLYPNAPTVLHQFVAQLGTILGFFLFSAILAVPVYRDYEHQIASFLYAYPLRKSAYLGGRLIGSLLVATVVIAGIPLGMMLGEGIARLTKEATEIATWGPFRVDSYLMPMLTVVLPNLLFLGAIYFAIPTLTRKIFFSYVLGIGMIVLYSITASLLQITYEGGYKRVAYLLDPFGFRAVNGVTEYWTVAEQNLRTIPLEGDFLLNRVIWAGIGLLVVAFTFWRFRFAAEGVGGGRRRIEPETGVVVPDAPIRLGSLRLDFGLGARLRQFLSILRVEAKATVGNVFFLVFMICISLFAIMDAIYANYTYETAIYPVTSVMLEVKDQTFGFVLMILLIYIAGEVVWRERQLRIDQVYDALPVPKSSTFLAKLASMLLVPLAVITILFLVLVTVQTAKGFYDYQFGLYFFDLYVLSFTDWCLLAIFAFSVQVVVNNKYLGHLIMVLYIVLTLVMGLIGMEHPLWRYGGSTNMPYSDLNGYGENALRASWFLLHWYLVAGLMLLLAYAFYVHGTESGLKPRLHEAARRWRRTPALRFGSLALLLACLGTGYHIWHETVVDDRYATQKDSEKLQVAYENTYRARWEHRPLAKVTAAKLHVELYPGEQRLTAKGSYWLKNKNSVPVDSMLVSINDRATFSFRFSKPAAEAPPTELERRTNLRRYGFATPLAPGDSVELQFEADIRRTGFDNPSGVLGNGTFVNNGVFAPSLGYNPGLELQAEDKRREYKLPPPRRLPDFDDSTAVQVGLFERTSDWIDFDITVGTAPDQVAVAPGYLQREWKENNRAYYHYKMDGPMLLFYNVLSGRYAISREAYKGVNIEVYYLPAHDYNIGKIREAVKASLDYMGTNFGPYPHRQVRILEFPRTLGTFAQSFANTIPFSEGFGFIAKLDDPKDVDYLWMVTSHEMAHQWWGNYVTPAQVRGGQFLSETMAEYSSLQVLKHQYGIGQLRKFLSLELDRYLQGRGGERRREDPLLEVEFQSYIYYRKGATVMFALQDYIGEDRFNQGLKQFVNEWGFKGPPYPTMANWYATMRTTVPDSLVDFFDDQIRRITLFDSRVVEAKGKVLSQQDSTYEIAMKVLAGKYYADSIGNMNDKPLPLGLPVDIGLLAAQVPTKQSDLMLLEKRYVPGTDTTQIVLKWRGKRPSYAGIDPIHKLIDRKRDDNLVQIDWSE